MLEQGCGCLDIAQQLQAVKSGYRHRWTERTLLFGGILLGLLLLLGLAVFVVLWFLNGAGQVLIQAKTNQSCTMLGMSPGEETSRVDLPIRHFVVFLASSVENSTTNSEVHQLFIDSIIKIHDIY